MLMRGMVVRFHRITIALQRAFRSGYRHPDRALFAGVCLLSLYALLAGLWHVSTNYDSLTYHLARTAYWQQNRSLDFYTTPVLHQLYHAPLSSIGMMWLNMVTGSDRFAFLVSWLSYVGSLVLVWKIARKLGTNGALAVVFAATVPMAFLQAGTTQNNLMVAFWLLAVVWFILDDAPLYVGIAAGLAMLTKNTAYLFLLPLLLWFAVRQLRTRRTVSLVLAGIIAASLNAPHWTRNLLWFGSPLPGTLSYGGVVVTYNNPEISPRMVISGIARTLAMHIPFPGDEITGALGMDVNDPAITWDGNPAQLPVTYWTDSTGGAPLHVAILLVVTVPALVNRRTRPYAVCLVFGFVLFAGLVKWLPWNARLHVPLLIAWAPVVACVIPRRLHRGLSWSLLLFAAYVVFANDERPPQRWFTAYTPPVYEVKYAAFAEQMKESECRHIYLYVSSNSPEYALHRLMPGWTFTHDPTDKRACATFYEYDTSGARQSGG